MVPEHPIEKRAANRYGLRPLDSLTDLASHPLPSPSHLWALLPSPPKHMDKMYSVRAAHRFNQESGLMNH